MGIKSYISSVITCWIFVVVNYFLKIFNIIPMEHFVALALLMIVNILCCTALFFAIRVKY